MSTRSLEDLKTMAGISHLVDDNNSPKDRKSTLVDDISNLRIN